MKWKDCTKSAATRGEMFKKLRAGGWQELGKGYYGTVLIHPEKPEVLKLGTYDGQRSPYSGGDLLPRDGWLMYVRRYQGSRSKHHPKVYSVELYATFYVARMERLREADQRRPDEQAIMLKAQWKVDSPGDHRGSLGRFGKRLEETFASCPIDCHRGNIMFRRDGTPVITDPIVLGTFSDPDLALLAA